MLLYLQGCQEVCKLPRVNRLHYTRKYKILSRGTPETCTSADGQQPTTVPLRDNNNNNNNDDDQTQHNERHQL